MEIKIPTTAPYDDCGRLFRTKTVVIEPGLNVLVGCNGSGKTTLLQMIKRALTKEFPDQVIHFDNLRDGGNNSFSSLVFHQMFDDLATMMCSSEGEKITQCLGSIAREIGNATRNNPDKPIFVLLDAVDSGLSIDHIVEVKKDLVDFVCELHPETYFITVANEYEMANGERCWDVTGSKEIRFSDYEDYKRFVLKSREKKNERYEKLRKEN